MLISRSVVTFEIGHLVEWKRETPLLRLGPRSLQAQSNHPSSLALPSLRNSNTSSTLVNVLNALNASIRVFSGISDGLQYML